MIKLTRKSTVDLLLLFWTAFATLFIFFNSAMDYVSSHSVSGNVTNIVYGNAENKEVLGLIVRKAAHMLEYAFLGTAVFLTSKRVYQQYKKSVFGFSLFYVLTIGVADEHIQSYSDRTSSTGDVLLDFFGALVGFFVGWVILKLYTKIRHYLRERRGRERV